jgi:hypothetical protein
MYKRSITVYIRRKEKDLLPGDSSEDSKLIIGSSMTRSGGSAKGISIEEENKYLPDLIDSDPTKQDWKIKVDEYWKNIRVPIPFGSGKKLEVGFEYKTQEDADNDKEIDFEVRPGITARILEGKNAVRPINVADYVLYRYCLIYSRVAKSKDVMYASPNIRFYLFSEEEERRTKVSGLNLYKKAFAKFIEISTDVEKMKDILYAMRIDISSLKTSVDIELTLDTLIKDRPNEFLEIANNKQLAMRSFVEKCITRVLLKRLPHTETILYDTTVIGNTMEEAIAYLTEERNRPVYTTLEARLKGLKTT